jgi:hypothetical protein
MAKKSIKAYNKRKFKAKTFSARGLLWRRICFNEISLGSLTNKYGK